MKQKISIVLAIVLAIGMMPLMAWTASAATDGDYTYDIVDGEAVLTGYTGPDGNITIPSTLGGYPVTKIGDNASFRNDINFKGVTIPGSVKSIGVNAFNTCQFIESVINGTFKTTPYFYSLAEGAVDIMPLNKQLAEPGMDAAVLAARQRIIDGSFNVFDGVLETNTGTLIGEAGKTLSDEIILGGMNWYYRNIAVIR